MKSMRTITIVVSILYLISVIVLTNDHVSNQVDSKAILPLLFIVQFLCLGIFLAFVYNFRKKEKH